MRNEKWLNNNEKCLARHSNYLFEMNLNVYNFWTFKLLSFKFPQSNKTLEKKEYSRISCYKNIT